MSSGHIQKVICRASAASPDILPIYFKKTFISIASLDKLLMYCAQIYSNTLTTCGNKKVGQRGLQIMTTKAKMEHSRKISDERAKQKVKVKGDAGNLVHM